MIDFVSVEVSQNQMSGGAAGVGAGVGLPLPWVPYPTKLLPTLRNVPQTLDNVRRNHVTTATKSLKLLYICAIDAAQVLRTSGLIEIQTPIGLDNRRADLLSLSRSMKV